MILNDDYKRKIEDPGDFCTRAEYMIGVFLASQSHSLLALHTPLQISSEVSLPLLRSEYVNRCHARSRGVNIDYGIERLI